MDNPSTEELIRKRKEAIKKILGKNKFTYVFSILAFCSLILGLLPSLFNSIFSTLFGFFGPKLPILIKQSSLFGLPVDIGYIFLGVAFTVSAFLSSREKFKLSFYPILVWLAWLASYLRTLNLSGLRDITTGSWTLGPDLDPWLFTRWAKEIVETGTLAAVDTMRYVPIGFPTKEEFLLHPYMIAWFHKVASVFGSESMIQSAALYPAFFFVITVVAFFFLVRKIFLNSLGSTKSNIIGLIASFFLTTIPSLIPRTIAGIPEKESSAFFFLFLSFYFFLCAWNSKARKTGIIYSILAGAATAGMALIWGGYIYIIVTIGLTTAIAFILGKFDLDKVIVYTTWLISSFSLMSPFALGYSFKGFLQNTVTSSAIFLAFVFILDYIVHGSSNFKKILDSKAFSYLPRQLNSFIMGTIVALIFSIIFTGFDFLKSLSNYVISNLIQPAQSRLIQTVAENRQPFFTEWAGSFGPNFLGNPLIFWLFFIGSIFLFKSMLGNSLDKRKRMILTISYSFLITAISFSRYSGSSTFNGTNTQSLIFYSLGFVIFFGVFGYYYINERREGNNTLKKVDYSILMALTFFILSLITARGAVRLIMILAFPASILTSYFLVQSYFKLISQKGDKKFFARIILTLIIFLIVFSGFFYLNAAKQTAQGYVPSAYNQQWQYAMSWVRENTSKDAVFGHWWDYGYWLQGIGERSTILDGGNAVSYWNHLMGRHALTSPDNRAALEFLYAHNATHFLIDSTDIGKYGAFSSIGSDASYDRASYLPVMNKNPSRISETKNGTLNLYEAGIGLDEDIVYQIPNGEKIFLPSGRAALGGIQIELSPSGQIISQPIAFFIDQGKQINLPLRYAFDTELKEYDEGIEAGIRIIPRAVEGQQGQGIDMTGSLIYLSKRTVNAQLTRLYLYGEEGNGFSLAHSEDDFVVKSLKQQGLNDIEFINFRGFRGPIKIWEINYPSDIYVKEEYLETVYPEELYVARK